MLDGLKMIPTSLSIEEVNKLASDNFIKIFGNVVEHYPTAAIGILKNRPFQDITNISEAISSYLDGISASEKQKVLQLHPDLAGKLADLGKLSAESTQEQKSVGLDSLSVEEKNKLTKFNEEYIAKFGFPFVICVRENKVFTILNAIEQRLANDKDQELDTGIEEVKKISKLRIFEIVKH